MISTIPVILASFITFDWAPTPVPEYVARQCAAEVGIPYASDNFTDREWVAFQRCVIRRSYSN